MRKPIVVVGSINLDLVVSPNRLPLPGQTVFGSRFQTFYGGKGANQAVGVARLRYPVRMIGRVGDDEFGDRLRQGLRNAGVNARSVKATPGTSSGVALISVDSEGANTIVVVPGANGRLAPPDIKRSLALICSAGMILTQLEVPLVTIEFLAEAAYAHGIPLMLDPAPACPLSQQLLKRVSWLTPNETETTILCGCKADRLNLRMAREYAHALLERGVRNVVIKMGDRGAFAAGSAGWEKLIPVFRVRAVDSTASGDAFNAGLAVALMKGEAPLDAVRFASGVAALSVTRHGAQPSMPTDREVAGFLRRSQLKARRPLQRRQPTTLC